MTRTSRTGSDAALLLESESENQERKTGRYAVLIRLSICYVIAVLKPSFLHPSRRSAPSRPQHPTAWLDGVRGVAAFNVFIYHFQRIFHEAYNLGYASNGGANDHWLIQLSILRLIPNGQVQVATFYVLSGISLSLKPIQLARSHAWEACCETMFSSIFRRALRLYLPVLAVQTGVLLATLLGLFNHAYTLSHNWHFAGNNEPMFPILDSKLAQIQHWLGVMWTFVNPFMPIYPIYNVHLWTIPIEFRNSIILFATLVGLSKLRPGIRTSLTMTLWAYCMCVNQSETALFYAGMAIAEYMLIQDETPKQFLLIEALPGGHTVLPRVFWGAMCFIGLHLLSWPGWRSESTPGFVTLNRLTPHFFNSAEHTWQRIGAALFVFALSGCAFLRRPFETPLATYLGKISFPLYILHGNLNHMLGLWLVETFWKITGSESFVGYETGVFLAFCTEAIVVVWLADLVMRTVDEPSVRFGRVLQKMWACNEG